MSLEPLDRPDSEPAETRPDGPGRVEEAPQAENQGTEPARIRPDPLKLFRARWEHNRPAYEFLAGKHK